MRHFIGEGALKTRMAGSKNIFRMGIVSIATLGLLGGCVSETTMGGGAQNDTVSGGAGPNGAQNASSQLEKCSQPLGIITLVESQDMTMAQMLQSLKLTSPTPVLKLIIQQSGCFQMVDRGLAMQTIKQERELTGMGETRTGSNMGGGQIVTPDLAVTPNILWSGQTGGAGGGLAGMAPGWGGLVAGAVMGAMRESKAQVMLTVTDVRSTLQLAAAEGNATSNDFSLGAALFGGGFGGAGGGAFGAYSSTPEGKTITAALVDAYNNVVRSVRGMPPLPSIAQLRQPSPSAISGETWVANGKLVIYAHASSKSEVIGRLTPGTVVERTGNFSKDKSWTEVQAGENRGWVRSSTIHRK